MLAAELENLPDNEDDIADEEKARQLWVPRLFIFNMREY